MVDLASTRIYYETRDLCHKDVYKHLVTMRKSLLELRLVSKKALLNNTLCWQKEVEKARIQKDQEWSERISQMEAENKRLRALLENGEDFQEWSERISQMEAENKQLKALVENGEDFQKEGEAPEKHFTESQMDRLNRQVDRLGRQLDRLNRQVDRLGRQLDQKLIHVNRLQLALAQQSKAMFELEKSYVLLYQQYMRVCQKKSLSPKQTAKEL